ncbi:uncharacterized protein LOC142632918 [Castanea sativa]|uniref:uncharacterized protein LOC142632918 n=1 Tax=Castanea sativa TaxID=21020 RepID=UPI003F64B80A
MAMREGETLKTYSDRYWEMFNEIDGDFDDVAIRTFKVGLPAEHNLRKSLTKKPVRSGNHSGAVYQGSTSSRPPLGTINVIFATLGRTGSHPSKVMSMARTLAKDSSHEPKRIKGSILPFLGFSEEDKIGTIQLHDDALVVTLRIGATM